MPLKRSLLAVLTPCVLAFAGGCVSPRTPAEPSGGRGGAGAWAFAPASLRLHPLTRVLNPPRGLPVIELYAELTDRWGDTVKSTGRLRVELVRVGEGLDGATESVVRWEIDLSQLDENARLFDPATRTYRVRLEQAPAWIVAPEPGYAAQLKAVLTGTGPNGRAIVLQDELRLRLPGEGDEPAPAGGAAVGSVSPSP